MTDTTALAARLRAMSDEDLVALVAARSLPQSALALHGASAIADFFDLAEALSAPDAIDAALDRLPRATLAALNDGVGDRGPAIALGLASEDGIPDPPVVARLHVRSDLLQDGASSPTPTTAELVDVNDLDDDAALHAGAERAFSSMTAIAELLRQVQGGAVIELAKGGIGAPLLRQLAEDSGTADEEVVPLLRLILRARFADDSARAWTLTSDGAAWLVEPWGNRWLDLTTRWWHSLDPAVHGVLTAAGSRWDSLVKMGRGVYPGGASWLDVQLSEAESIAAAIGLTVSGIVTRTGRLLIAAALDVTGTAPDSARASAAADLPAPVDAVYVQHDLTVIAPGPLAPADDDALRTFARLEAPGLAARYRISEDSVRGALRAGWSRDDIIDALNKLSANGIPQPVAYVVDQVAERDGSIVVDRSDDGTHTVVRGPADQLDLIGIDAELRYLGWSRPTLTTLATRFPADIVQRALDDQRYPAVLSTAVPQSGPALPSPQRRRARAGGTTAARTIVERLRLTTARSDDESEQAWLARQIDIAIRGKVPIRIVVRMPGGDEKPFTIVPTAIASGRVRGRDPKADVERTLPLSHVVAVDSDA